MTISSTETLTGLSAKHWVYFKENRAECRLCPRHCRPKNDRMGFCGVRGTVNGEIQTFNYGQSLAATEELIETEAVNHFSPGARILSMGNVGCMMACSFCQNWETSQTQHLDYQMIRHYSPEQVVEMCLQNHIPIISWTYNDPVVWHEFVIKTSKLAQKNGIKTLYKSAFYIEEEPVNELINCIDIFSLSLKSLNDAFYRKHTKARLQPVLDRIKQVADAGVYLELSQLVIPELNDSDEDVEKTIDWVLKHIGTEVPMHFVAFHPAYQYTHVERTDLATLKRARDLALKKGMKYVYLGNTHEAGLNDTQCQQCGTTLVKRYGLQATLENLDEKSCCSQCGTQSPIIEPFLGVSEQQAGHKSLLKSSLKKQLKIYWNDEAQSAHILQLGSSGGDVDKKENNKDTLKIESLGIDGIDSVITKTLTAGLDRFIVSRQSPQEKGIVISWDSDFVYQNLDVLDRAHYPTVLSDKQLSNEQIIEFS